MRTHRILLAALGTLCAGLIALPSPAAAAPQCHGVDATIVGTDERDDLVGTSGRDVIVGGGGWDRIKGGGGNDVICGGKGADRLRGGPGRDRLFGGEDGYIPENGYFGDGLRGGPGDDRLRGGGSSGIDRMLYDTARHGIIADLASGVLTGQGHDTYASIEALVASPRRDEILVGGIILRVDGGAGADVIRCRLRKPCSVDGGAGNDRLLDARYGSGGDGDDRITGRASPRGQGAYLSGGDGDDVLIGTDRNDDIGGYGGRDLIRSGGGDDDVEGGIGQNTIRAGAGNDLVWDGPDHDTIVTGPGDDTVKGHTGDRETFDLGDGDDGDDDADDADGGHDLCTAETVTDCEG